MSTGALAEAAKQSSPNDTSPAAAVMTDAAADPASATARTGAAQRPVPARVSASEMANVLRTHPANQPSLRLPARAHQLPSRPDQKQPSPARQRRKPLAPLPQARMTEIEVEMENDMQLLG